MEILLVQTLKDRDNADHVEEHGPFICVKDHAWLGRGYYFWDTHLELGHWWGKVACSGNYMICVADGVIDSSCWDLHGNGKHRIELKEVCDELIKSKLMSKESITIPRLIEFLKKKGKFAYKAIRALGMRSMGDSNTDFILRFPFEIQNPSYLEVYPTVQICLIEKNALCLRYYRIVYPEHYSLEFA